MEKKQFRKVFRHLAKEVENREFRTTINSIRSETRAGEKASSKKFASYIPDVIDFIRRCDDEQQAKVIIAYLEKRGEISFKYAERLRKQLEEKGVRSFGPKKEEDYYLKRGCPGLS